MIQTFASLGALLLGIVTGFLLYRNLQRWMSMEFWNGVCSQCGKDGYVNICDRCSKHVGVCHSYRLLLPHGPGGLKPRPARTVCVACISPAEEQSLMQDKKL